jgi:hypothetical protein
MENKTTKQPEIKDGKLIIGNDTIDLKALEELLEIAGLEDFSNAIENVFFRLCQMGSICSSLTSEISNLGYGNCFPEVDDILYLKELSNSFKKM